MRPIDPQYGFDPERAPGPQWHPGSQCPPGSQCHPGSQWVDVAFSGNHRLAYAFFDGASSVRLECARTSNSAHADDALLENALHVNTLQDNDASLTLESLSATALAPDSGRDLVTYTLHLADLNEHVRSQIAHILVGTDGTNSSALQILRQLYALTGPDLWTTSSAQSMHTTSPEAFVHHGQLSNDTLAGLVAVRPPLGEYLQAPENLGRQFSVKRILPERVMRLEAVVFPEINAVRFTLFEDTLDNTRPPRSEGTFVRSGSLPNSAPTSEIQRDLQHIVVSALTQFEATGQIVFRKLEPSKSETRSITPFSGNQVTLSSGATVTTDVTSEGVRLLVCSGPLDRDTYTSSTETVCSWFFETPNPEIQDRTCRWVSRIALMLAQERDPSVVRQAFEELRQNVGLPSVESAPLSTILDPALVEYLSSQRDQILIDTPETLYSRAQDLVELLRGVQRFSVILAAESKTVENGYSVEHRQLFPKMDISIPRSSDGLILVELKNGLHQEVHATLGAKTVTTTAEVFGDTPEKHVLAHVCRAFTQQMRDDEPSNRGIADLLTLLGDLQKNGSIGTLVKQRGWGTSPRGDDLVGHNLIHRLASPLIDYYVSESGEILTDAFVHSPSPGECLIHIGERSHHYRLSIFTLSDSVCEMRVTPRRRNRDEGGTILDVTKAKGYSCRLPLTSAEQTQETLNKLKKVVLSFCELVEPVCVAGEVRRRKFGGSQLHRLLKKIRDAAAED